jgi:hypothetical protein
VWQNSPQPIETWENTRIWSAFSHLSNHVTCSTNAQQFRTTMRLIQYLHCTVLDGWRGCSARLQRSYYLWRWIGEAESTEAADAPPWSSPGSSNFFKGRDPHKLPLTPSGRSYCVPREACSIKDVQTLGLGLRANLYQLLRIIWIGFALGPEELLRQYHYLWGVTWAYHRYFNYCT